MPDIGYPLVDADNHYYEAVDAFTRHMDPKVARRNFQWTELNGRPTLIICGKVNHFIPNPTFDPVAKPGCLDDFFRGQNSAGSDIRKAFGELEPISPAYRNRDARLTLMDEQGVEACWLFPTLAVGVEEAMKHDAEITHTALHAFNEWHRALLRRGPRRARNRNRRRKRLARLGFSSRRGARRAVDLYPGDRELRRRRSESNHARQYAPIARPERGAQLNLAVKLN